MSIRFTAISGALNEDPLCYLLQLDEVNILLDCGASTDFSLNCIEALGLVHIDAVLLSHADMQHVGSLPMLMKDRTCPIFATLPVQTLSQIVLQDALTSIHHLQAFTDVTISDIDAVCDRMTPLRYSQPFLMSTLGITITAFAAGHSVGGSIWKIRRDGDDIVYAVDYNQKREMHLNGTVLHTGLNQLTRPGLLITDSYNALSVQVPRRDRDTALVDNIMATLKSNGNVIIPVDCATRMLELASVLDYHWSKHSVTFPLVFLSEHGQKTMNVAKTMLEWFSDSIAQAFSQQRELPFELRNFKVVTDMDAFTSRPTSKPQLVLVSTATLSTGFSYDLMHKWASNPSNLIILPDRGEQKSITNYLHEYWQCQLQGASQKNQIIQLNHSFAAQHKYKQLLSGEKLAQHEKEVADKLASDLLQASILKQQQQDSDDEDQVDLSVPLAQRDIIHPHDQYIYAPHTSLNAFFKHTTTHKMFPAKDPRKKFDDYGEIIDPEQYTRGEYHEALVQATFDKKAVVVEDVEVVKVEAPFEYVCVEGVIDFKCKLVYIDFEGRVDGKSIRNIIPQVAPRKLIIVHGSKEATEELVTRCGENEAMTDEIYAPAVGDVVDVSTVKSMYRCQISDALFSSLRFVKKGDYEIAFITGITGTTTVQSVKTVGSKREATEMITLNEHATPKRHKPLLVGDMKLSDFRKILQQKGFQTDFVQGDLMIADSGIIVKKNAGGRIVLEGRMCDAYYAVRELIYAQHVVLN